MFSQIRKFKFYDVRFSHVACSPSLANYILLQLHQFSSPATNALESSSKDPNPKSFAAVYLENNYGFPPKRALTYAKRLNFDSPEKPLYAIAFLKKHSFTDADISRIVKKWPVVLSRGPESNFLPKFEFLRSLGLSSSELVKVLTLQPNLLDRSLERQIIPCVDFLRSLLGSNKDVVFSILRHPGILRETLQKTLLPNVGILRDVGVPESHIAALLRAAPRRIALDPGNFKLAVQEVIDLGFNPATKGFITALKVMRQLNSLSWREKVKHYTRWGWSEDQVFDAIRKYPLMMAVSKEKITKISDLIINTMACDASIFMTRPVIFTLSFEGRIAPRCAFYQVLLSKGLVRRSSLASMIVRTPSLFVEKYVKPFGEEDPELLKLYEDLFGKSKA
ncbi:uncharacterized protein LOC130991683 isoform X2 [Salvia miltiorrhiza]|uniref:uncharacterized protein LOC130991683 isoform X2 n=1 Tax=Salvia miltiorrhiza TaxID=226208 RepID=UPI0025AC7EFD|nr:uncharacterized protein LOC130991683 isoform X2 [Salvia miltiorrhiza]